MKYRVAIDRKIFIELFDRGEQSMFNLPILLKYDPVVENPGNTEYLYLRFETEPTPNERILIELALSPVLYTVTEHTPAHHTEGNISEYIGPAVSDQQ
jgi:hypothetical protein